MAKILILGWGRMGHIVQMLAQQMGHEIVGIYDPGTSFPLSIGIPCSNEENPNQLFSQIALQHENVQAVCFARHSDTLIATLEAAGNHGFSMAVGTTALEPDEKAQIEVISRKVPIVFTTNFSRGVNIWWNTVVQVVGLFYPAYDIEIIEKHHRNKGDSPSGSAETLVDMLIAALTISRKKVHYFRRKGKTKGRPKGHIYVLSIRGGSIAGEHEIWFLGDKQRFYIGHIAEGPEVFALGAFEALGFVQDKESGLFTMGDVIQLVA